jgi:hypothetical protein
MQLVPLRLGTLEMHDDLDAWPEPRSFNAVGDCTG